MESTEQLVDVMNSIRQYVSRNEFHTRVTVSRDAYWELVELSSTYEFLYVDIEEELGDELDIEVTLDLDQWAGR